MACELAGVIVKNEAGVLRPARQFGGQRFQEGGQLGGVQSHLVLRPLRILHQVEAQHPGQHLWIQHPGPGGFGLQGQRLLDDGPRQGGLLAGVQHQWRGFFHHQIQAGVVHAGHEGNQRLQVGLDIQAAPDLARTHLNLQPVHPQAGLDLRPVDLGRQTL
jgi:hypothetical protein